MQLAVHAGEVSLDGRDADEQLGGDLAVAPSGDDELGDAGLGRRQLVLPSAGRHPLQLGFCLRDPRRGAHLRESPARSANTSAEMLRRPARRSARPWSSSARAASIRYPSSSKTSRRVAEQAHTRPRRRRPARQGRGRDSLRRRPTAGRIAAAWPSSSAASSAHTPRITGHRRRLDRVGEHRNHGRQPEPDLPCDVERRCQLGEGGCRSLRQPARARPST